MGIPTPRTAEDQGKDVQLQLALLERRLANILPDRLSTAGQFVEDWDAATVVGFYWGLNAANAPAGGGSAGGTVTYDASSDVVFQEVRRADDPTTTWVRSRSAAGVWSTWTPLYGGRSLPFAEAAGRVTIPTSLANGAYVDVTTTFPAGRFTVAPRVTFGSQSVRATVSHEGSVSTSGMTVRVLNGSGSGSVPSGTRIDWVAVQMTPTTGDG